MGDIFVAEVVSFWLLLPQPSLLPLGEGINAEDSLGAAFRVESSLIFIGVNFVVGSGAGWRLVLAHVTTESAEIPPQGLGNGCVRRSELTSTSVVRRLPWLARLAQCELLE